MLSLTEAAAGLSDKNCAGVHLKRTTEMCNKQKYNEHTPGTKKLDTEAVSKDSVEISAVKCTDRRGITKTMLIWIN